MRKRRIVSVLFLLCLTGLACGCKPALIEPVSWALPQSPGVQEEYRLTSFVIRGTSTDREVFFRRLNRSPEEIFQLVKGILKVGVSVSPVKVQLLPDKRAVKKWYEFIQLLKAKPVMYRELVSFYEAGEGIIYLSLADAREGILAHEIAHHCLIRIGVPREEQEARARYVEEQLIK